MRRSLAEWSPRAILLGTGWIPGALDTGDVRPWGIGGPVRCGTRAPLISAPIGAPIAAGQDLLRAGFERCFGTNSVANFGGANPNFGAYSFAYRVSLCALRTVPFVMTLVRNPARGRGVGGGHAGGGRCRFSSSNQSPWLGGTMTSTSMPFSASRCAAA